MASLRERMTLGEKLSRSNQVATRWRANVSARDLGFSVGLGNDGPATLTALNRSRGRARQCCKNHDPRS